jgi:hypothetical protein
MLLNTALLSGADFSGMADMLEPTQQHDVGFSDWHNAMLTQLAVRKAQHTAAQQLAPPCIPDAAAATLTVMHSANSQGYSSICGCSAAAVALLCRCVCLRPTATVPLL